MKALSAFYDYLLPELPGCMPALVDLHLRAVARELCDRTDCWQESLQIVGEAERFTYPYFAPLAKTEPVRMLKLDVDGALWWQAIEPVLLDERRITQSVGLTVPRYRADQPPFTLSSAGDELTFTVSMTGTATLLGSIRPTLDATQLPDFMLTTQLEPLRMGTLSRLMAMGGKPWTDRDLASVYGTEWGAWLNLRAMQAASGNTRSMLRTRSTTI